MAVAPYLGRVVQWLAVTAVALTGLSWIGRGAWPLELLTHFRMQFVVGALLILLLAVVVRRPASSVAAVLVAAVNALPLAPYLVPAAVGTEAGEGSTRILFANVQVGNDDYPAVLALVAGLDPDIVAFAEVDAAWLAELSVLQEEYAYSIAYPNPDAYGLALYSRLPFVERATSPYVQDGVPTALIVDVEMPSSRATLLLAHPKSPVSPGRAALRNLQLKTLAEMIQTDSHARTVLIGDLNTTPWSPHYAQLEQRAGLSNAASGRGYSPTWPVWTGGPSVLKIPIDHCLVSKGVQVRDFRTGPEIGSDHLPIVVDLAMTASGVRDTLEPDAG